MLRELFLVPSLVLGATAQVQWSLQSPPTTPTPFSAGNLVHDPVLQRAFRMWGGNQVTDMWMWNGADWSQCSLTVSSVLLAHRECGVVWDGTGIVMFGGWRAGIGIGGGTPSVVDETWRITGSAAGNLQFTLLNPAVRPAPRQGLAMVGTGQGALVFGGSALQTSIVMADTWQWNGTSWSQLAPATSPSARSRAAMAYDAARNVVVLFGGSTGVGVLGDTWEFDGVTWHARTSVQQPPARMLASFAWSPTSGRCVLFGGTDAGGVVAFADHWEWDGSQWTQALVQGGPGARQGMAWTWDTVQQKVLAVGGVSGQVFNDTWYVDDLTSPASYTAFGAGCVGPTAQVPQLAAAPNESPRVGTTLHLELSNLPAGSLSLPVVVLGLSNTFDPAGSYPLPVDLGFLGWPGCQQLVSPDVLVPIPTTAGQVTHTINVPLSFGLLGFTFHAQGIVLYVPSGAAVSNGLTALIGT